MLLRRFHWLPLLILILGATAAVFGLVLRHRAEAKSRAVSLVLDYGQLRDLAFAANVPLDQAYKDFKSAGATGIAFTEETLADLETAGLIRVVTAQTDTGREFRVATPDAELRERIAQSAIDLMPGVTERVPEGDRVVLEGPGGGSLFIPGRFEEARGFAVGLSTPDVQSARQAGLEPVGRILNSMALTAPRIEIKLRRARDEGISQIIFGGEEVLGYRGLIKDTAQTFRDLGLMYGSVEFGKQRGDEELSRLLLDRLLRVHSISSAEMLRLPESEAIERYVRAPVERNIRIDYIRLPGVASASTYQDNLEYLRKLARSVVKEGFGLSPTPMPFQDVWPSHLIRRAGQATIAAGAGAGAVLLLAGIIPLSAALQAGVTLAAALSCAALAGSGIGLGLQLVALLTAVVFPTLGFVLFPQPVGAFEDHEHAIVRERGEAIVPAVAEFAAISLVTLLGAGMIGALLADLPYLVKVKSFAGIKASTVLPILLVGWIYLSGMSGEYPDVRTEMRAVGDRVRTFLSEPIRVWHTVAMLVGLVALALLVLRSGNDPGVGVSELELRFRSLLDRFLGVRPRTKEFMLGHPALILALAMAVSPQGRRWALPVLLLGVIGQAGMLNSFCHLHSPLKLTLIRTWNGLWIGVLLGMLLVQCWAVLQGKKRRPNEPHSV
jgi:hypothetical protein